ncbi:hypothetical protein BDN72DRAFT_841625, partial [Pluteus cervinus]
MFKRWKKGRKKLVGDIGGRARLKYAGGGVWSYFGARRQTMINAQRHKMASLTSFKIIITQGTGPWPRLAGI